MRLRTLAPALTTLAMAMPATRPAMAALPDWAVALADAAPALPSEAAPWSSRVLLSEVRVAIQPDGALRIRRRLATQALSVRTEKVGTGYFAFDAAARVTATRAWHVPQGEKGRRSREMPIDLATDDAFLSDNRVRMIPVEGVRKGSLLFFEFEAIERPAFISLAHLFYEGVPVLSSRYLVETPPGWTVRPVWAHGQGPAPSVQGSLWSWEMRDLPAPVEEPLADDPADRAPLLMTQIAPPAGAKVAPATWKDWPALSAWYDDLARGRADVSPAIEAAARRVAADEGAGFFEAVGAAARFVRDSVRYTAIELGIGGYQPRPAAETLANLYGDCKDKGTLFRAILSARGIDSYAVLVRQGGVDAVTESVPVWSFNHFVVAVPIPAGAQVPATFQPAVAADGDRPPLLIFDTTDDYAAIGSLPAALEGRRGLLVDGPRGRVLAFPAGDPSAHIVVRRSEVEVRPGGTLAFRRTTTLSGELAARERQEDRRSALDRRHRVEGAVTHRWPDAAVLDYQVTGEDDEGRFREVLSIVRKRGGAVTPLDRLPLFPWMDDEIEQVPLGRRKIDVVYPHPMTIRHDTAVAGVPGTAALPPSRTLSGPGWSVTIETRRAGSLVQGSAEARLSRRRFTPAEFPELRRFWSAVTAAAGVAIALDPGGAGP